MYKPSYRSTLVILKTDYDREEVKDVINAKAFYDSIHFDSADIVSFDNRKYTGVEYEEIETGLQRLKVSYDRYDGPCEDFCGSVTQYRDGLEVALEVFTTPGGEPFVDAAELQKIMNNRFLSPGKKLKRINEVLDGALLPVPRLGTDSDFGVRVAV